MWREWSALEITQYELHERSLKILSAFSESRPSLGALLPAAPNIIPQDTRRIVDHVFVCREYHGTLTEDIHGSIWGNMEGLSSKAAISIAVESPVHFDQAELQDENATNTFSEGQ